MDDLLSLSAHLPEVAVAAGDAVVREGESAGAIWVLVSGSLEVLKGQVVVNTITRPGSLVGEVSVLLNSVLRTPNRDRGHGAANRLLYSNPAMDELVAAAEVEMDEAKREDLLRRASTIALDDRMLVPLYLQNALWAMRSGLTYEARMDERNDPAAVRPAAR